MGKVVIVTGGSSGIGKEVCRQLANSGCTVYEFSRRHISQPGVQHMSLDVTDEDAVNDAVNTVAQREGRIDVLINNAGFGISGCIELTKNDDARRLMDVNLMGVVNTCKAVIPHMRTTGGRIINISSVAGPLSIPFQAWYSISKSAVLAFTDALLNEVRPWGISVCSVLPGDIKSGFSNAREKSIEGDELYGGRISRSVKAMEHDEQTGMTSEFAGKNICHIAMKKRVKPHYIIGNKYRLFMFLATILPNRTVSYIISLMYAK
jgi:NAD(P)-dependent dehydrogenase (short-subunit alcohol dehydrogenase family)